MRVPSSCCTVLAAVALAAACADSATSPHPATLPLRAKQSQSSNIPVAFYIESSPGLQVDATGPNYVDAVCGVRALLYTNSGEDAALGPSLDWSSLNAKQKQACGNQPRTLTIVYAESGSEGITNLDIYAVGYAGTNNNPDPSRTGEAGANTTGACGLVEWGMNGADPVYVSPPDTVNGKRIWTVTTTGANQAWCNNLGVLRTVQFALTISEQ